MINRTNRIELKLLDSEVAVLDELRGRAPRATFLRSLLQHAGPMPVASQEEALELLSASARAGSVTAQIALCRFLRDAQTQDPQDDVESAIAKILSD